MKSTNPSLINQIINGIDSLENVFGLFNSSSEEQFVMSTRLKTSPKFNITERAFFNKETNSIQTTFPYMYEGAKIIINIPNTSSNSSIIKSLLHVSQLVVRIAVFYRYQSSIEIIFGSGILINNKHILTSAHSFDPVYWENNKVSYSKILITRVNPASASIFPLSDHQKGVYSARIIQCGLIEEKINDYTEIKNDFTDLALLELEDELKHITPNQYFDPKFGNESAKLNPLTINSKLYLVGYNGELRNEDELDPYAYLKEFNNSTIDKLNYYHHVNYKSVSLGTFIKKADEKSLYNFHNCSTLPGSSGSIILDYNGNLAGIHIGINNYRQTRENCMFFNNETYNKYISITSNQFQKFIREAIIPNIQHDELLVKKWLFDSQ